MEVLAGHSGQAGGCWTKRKFWLTSLTQSTDMGRGRWIVFHLGNSGGQATNGQTEGLPWL